jgi:membrane protease YdiL (CAAX protease family)
VFFYTVEREAKMIPERYKNITILLEGFAVLFLSKLFFTTRAAKLHFELPFVPDMTMILLAALVACIVTIFYLLCRTNYIPTFTLNNETILYSFFGIAIMWIFHLISSIILVKHAAPLDYTINCKDIYKYLNILCAIMLLPITEEVIYRGYFIKLLMPKGTLSALLITSGLFACSHLLLRNYSSLEMLVLGIYFFIFSMTAGFVRIRAGLVAAIFVHVFNNSYVLIINS